MGVRAISKYCQERWLSTHPLICRMFQKELILYIVSFTCGIEFTVNNSLTVL